MTIQDEQYRKQVEEKYTSNLELYNEISLAGLKLLERQYQLVGDLTTTICTLSFAVGAAVVPLISQFSGNNKLKNPDMLLLAACILVLNGTLILLRSKKAIDDESLVINEFGLAQLISITKTRSVQQAYLTGQANSAEVDKRLKEQVDDAQTIINRPKSKERRISLAMDGYLFLMLSGFALIGASIVSGHSALVSYWKFVGVIGALFVGFVIDSLVKAIKSNSAKDKLMAQLAQAESYRVT